MVWIIVERLYHRGISRCGARWSLRDYPISVLKLASLTFCRPSSSGLASLFLSVAMLAAMFVVARLYGRFPGDEWALLELLEIRQDWLYEAITILSGIGNAGIGLGIPFPWIPVGVVAGLLAARRWGDALFVSFALLAPVINLGLKELASRPRPDQAMALVVESGYAFPSGHVVFAVALFGALSCLTVRWGVFGCGRVLGWLVLAAMGLLVLGVGFSRVYLGVHWHSDVVAGLLLGGTWLGIIIVLRQSIKVRTEPRG